MESIFTINNLFTLGMLTLLQAVLGFDNLLYISLESKRAPISQQAMVRRWGIGIAIVLRIALLFILVNIIQYFQDPLFDIGIQNVISCSLNMHSIIVFFGGVFILYTATREIMHMMNLENLDHNSHEPKYVKIIIMWIVAMNLIFSFDSILSAMAFTDVFWVMAVAIIISGVMMIWLADRVSEFLQKNRMYEVLGLFILFVVGIVLLSEGGHLAHLELFNHKITPMSKANFYFIIGILVLTDIVQTQYQKKLMKSKRK